MHRGQTSRSQAQRSDTKVPCLKLNIHWISSFCSNKVSDLQSCWKGQKHCQCWFRGPEGVNQSLQIRQWDFRTQDGWQGGQRSFSSCFLWSQFTALSSRRPTPAKFQNLFCGWLAAWEFHLILAKKTHLNHAGTTVVLLTYFLQHANSFNMNPSKWMLVNFDCSTMW